MKIIEIPTADLIMDLDVDSALYDKRSLLPPSINLMASIRRLGVITPITVCRTPRGYVVVDGRRRVTAALACAHPSVPCVIQDGEELDHLGIMVAANELRLEDTPLNRARKAEKALDCGYDKIEIATWFGVAASTIDTWIKLLSLPPSVRTAIDSGIVSATSALQLHGKPEEEQAEVLVGLLEEDPKKKPSAERVRQRATNTERLFYLCKKKDAPADMRMHFQGTMADRLGGVLQVAKDDPEKALKILASFVERI